MRLLDDPELVPTESVKVEPFHSWVAHYRCSRKLRDKLVVCVIGTDGTRGKCYRPVKIEGFSFTRACKTRFRERLIRRLERWRYFAPWTLDLPSAELALDP